LEHRPEFELYDLDKDPDELLNLAQDPAHLDTLVALRDKIKAFQKRTDDPWLVKWKHE
jgi:N-sulfoglucosamine sulfohydrolase